jgi:hypothetical protein
MQMDKKPHLDFLQTLSKSALIANLYGKLFAVKDMQMILLKQEAEIEEQIKKADSNV